MVAISEAPQARSLLRGVCITRAVRCISSVEDARPLAEDAACVRPLSCPFFRQRLKRWRLW
jgi:hypothetical protein